MNCRFALFDSGAHTLALTGFGITGFGNGGGFSFPLG